MKTLMMICFCAGFVVLSGCDSKKPATASNATNESTTTPFTAPADYLGALNKGQIAAEKTADLASLKTAIQMFQAEHDRYPRDLNELVTEGSIARLPQTPRGFEYKYDAASGKVSVVPKAQ